MQGSSKPLQMDDVYGKAAEPREEGLTLLECDGVVDWKGRETYWLIQRGVFEPCFKRLLLSF